MGAVAAVSAIADFFKLPTPVVTMVLVVIFLALVVLTMIQIRKMVHEAGLRRLAREGLKGTANAENVAQVLYAVQGIRTGGATPAAQPADDLVDAETAGFLQSTMQLLRRLKPPGP